MQVVILAGGLATRLGKLTQNVPKSLLPIQGRPFIDWQIELLIKNEIKDIVICLGHMGERVENYLSIHFSGKLDLKYSYDGKKALGTGGAIKKALPLLKEKFVLIFGDSYLDVNFKELYSKFLDSKSLAMMLYTRNLRDSDQANISKVNEELILYNKFEKLSDMNYIDFGLSCFSKRVFTSDLVTEESFDLALLLNSLSRRNLLNGLETTKRFYEVGSLEGINEFQKFLSHLNKREG